MFPFQILLLLAVAICINSAQYSTSYGGYYGGKANYGKQLFLPIPILPLPKPTFAKAYSYNYGPPELPIYKPPKIAVKEKQYGGYGYEGGYPADYPPYGY